ncbi:hypothetical protein [Microbacterium sp. CH12i]|nr:hypothetical protein [Microbacterium sp. CH12i]
MTYLFRGTIFDVIFGSTDMRVIGVMLTEFSSLGQRRPVITQGT